MPGHCRGGASSGRRHERAAHAARPDPGPARSRWDAHPPAIGRGLAAADKGARMLLRSPHRPLVRRARLRLTVYAELHCHSNYSFLEGASHPEELVARARELEIPALAITDRNGLYGAVRFFHAARTAGVHPIIGTELTLDDGTPPPKDRVDFDS